MAVVGGDVRILTVGDGMQQVMVATVFSFVYYLSVIILLM